MIIVPSHLEPRLNAAWDKLTRVVEAFSPTGLSTVEAAEGAVQQLETLANTLEHMLAEHNRLKGK